MLKPTVMESCPPASWTSELRSFAGRRRTVYLYEDGGFQMLDKADCSLVGVGTREFDFLNLHACDAAGKEVFWTAAIDVPVTPTPGKILLAADNERRMLMGRNTDMEC